MASKICVTASATIFLTSSRTPFRMVCSTECVTGASGEVSVGSVASVWSTSGVLGVVSVFSFGVCADWARVGRAGKSLDLGFHGFIFGGAAGMSGITGACEAGTDVSLGYFGHLVCPVK